MACNVINSWTLSGLVGAFVDLSIAYLLLCGSSLAYLASKFLGLFGKSLPCPCKGQPHNCFQSTLVNKPHLKISTVQSCVMEKLPFDSICNKLYDEEQVSKKKSIRANKACFGLRRRKRLVVGYDTKALSFSNHTPNESEDAWETSKEIGLRKPRSQDFELCDMDSKIHKADDMDQNEIIGLEQGLDDARTALYLELDKERTAAATAADEAMAMILRLQEEKATIEMEARQYQRMMEEKFAYDAQEMNILKEILLRREREKHFLEKQVEAYKQMFCDKEVSDMDMDMYDLEAIHEQRTSNAEQQFMSLQEKSIVEEEQRRETSPVHCLSPEAKIIFPYDNEKKEKRGEDSHGTHYHLLDVHVVNDEPDMPQTCVNQTIERYRKSNSGPSRVKSLRRNSMSAFDYERLKIDNEVGWLRGRLKMIQKGRDKLNKANGSQHLTDPEKQKALRRASLPHQSSKIYMYI